ncbi:defective mitochondrial respiration family member protein 1 [Aphelenchoides avenae]|nr:defective mitochondrial respiration family member protein 1 [Aphelenchus avenae]
MMVLSGFQRFATPRLMLIVRIPVRMASTTGPKSASMLASNSAHGHFAYERNVSRDPKSKNPQMMGDTPTRQAFMLRRLGHAYEVYPLIFLVSAWFVLFVVTVWYSFGKVEVWLDRSQDKAPWDWERIRDKYWKMNTVLGDINGITHQRLEIMELLQDEMVEAAKKRGTR